MTYMTVARDALNRYCIVLMQDMQMVPTTSTTYETMGEAARLSAVWALLRNVEFKLEGFDASGMPLENEQLRSFEKSLVMLATIVEKQADQIKRIISLLRNETK